MRFRDQNPGLERSRLRQRTAVLAIGSFAGLAAVVLWARIDREVAVHEGPRVVMGTFSRIVAIAPNRSTALRGIEAAFKDQQRIEEMMSFHRSDSELARINSEAYKNPVQISESMVAVLREALEISRLSDGAFDVTVGPLMNLMKSAGEEGMPPADGRLKEALGRVGWDKIRLDPNRRIVRFAVPGMEIDLGGIAKGYAVDRCVEILKKQGAKGGMVDLGGNIRCFGKPPKGQDGWRIGIQDPFQTEEPGLAAGGVVLILKLTDQAAATSAHYRRFFQGGDRKISHILDPRTGASAEDPASVTILARDAMTADALSTAVSVLGQEKGLAMVERIPGVEAVLIPRRRPGEKAAKLEILKTPGAENFIDKPWAYGAYGRGGAS